MAMSKADFIALGEQTYRKGGGRPVGNSWQIKAQQIGFDEAEIEAKVAQNDSIAVAASKLVVDSPQEPVSKATDSPRKADENQSEGVGSLTVENRATGPESKADFQGRVETEKGVHFSSAAHRSAFHHIDNLKLQFSFEVNPVRKERLRLKIYKLSGKWNMRAWA